ncbi:MAG: CDP-glycerol glycerophosphotransferase family protein [Clostridia bacterium]|nr:CDP-glycerol glycerophosphotransferase family protein [Clostridia bacterium]
MSEIYVELTDNNLIIDRKRYRKTDNAINIDLGSMILDKVYEKRIKSLPKFQKNTILLLRKIENCTNDTQGYDISYNEVDSSDCIDDRYLLVYTNSNNIKYVVSSKSKVYKHLISLKYKVLNVRLTKKKVSFVVLAYIVNKYNLPIKNINFKIGDVLQKKTELKQYKNKISKKKMLSDNLIHKYEFEINEIINDDSFINGAVKFSISVDNVDTDFQIGKKQKNIKTKKDYYIPMISKYVNNYAIHVRRTMKGNFILVKRLMEPVEYKRSFRFLESKCISRCFYCASKLMHRRKKINIFFEKFSEKAEEGTFELCKMAQKSSKSKNYYIIDKNVADYEKIKHEKFVIPKYSFSYYWKLYNATTFIATETQMHSNILRSNNRYLRKSINEKKFVFLQHGIIFMKNLGINSTFIAGREAEPNYMIVSSEYEKEVVTDMLNLPEERLLKTGLALYSRLQYNHINNESEDYVTVMLTWKPYEEFLTDFSQSSYYNNVISIYGILKKYIPEKNIRIVAHPKVYELLQGTDLRELIWKNSVSECLETTKLLITDYSSVCYNAFYQGAGVIFYQPDLEKYESENGKLIPNENEYIGERIFNENALDELFSKSIFNQKINLEVLRRDEYKKVYSLINEFCDGENINRIYEELIGKDIL